MNESQHPLNAEKLNQFSKKELMKMVLTQQKVIEKLQLEIQRLKLSRETDSKTSSLPLSTDLLKKSEKAKDSEDTASSEPKKRLHGEQPGHQGKTRQGFSRVNRIEILKPSVCMNCGQTDFLDEQILVETQQVAQLVAQPIEVVE